MIRYLLRKIINDELEKKTFWREWRWVIKTDKWIFIPWVILDSIYCVHSWPSYWFIGGKLKSLIISESKESCKSFEKRLKSCYIPDINIDDLFNELDLLQKPLSLEYNTVNGILNFLKMINTYPFSCLAYKILLIVLIIVASMKKTF